jgi:hypothetical protein
VRSRCRIYRDRGQILRALWEIGLDSDSILFFFPVGVTRQLTPNLLE